MISSADRALLRDFASVAGGLRIPWFLVGAGARILVCDGPAGRTGRATSDWDLAVSVPDRAAFDRLREAMTAGGAFRRTTPVRPDRAAHERFTHAAGERLDVIPFGGIEGSDRRVASADGGTSLAVKGFREAHADAVLVRVDDGFSILVARPRGLALLKSIAWLDRGAYDPTDLLDLDRMLATYADVLGLEVTIETAGDALRDQRVAFEDAGAFLLGREVGRTFGASGSDPAAAVAEVCEDPWSLAVGLLARSGSAFAGHEEREAISRRWAAFAEGLREGVAPGRT